MDVRITVGGHLLTIDNPNRHINKLVEESLRYLKTVRLSPEERALIAAASGDYDQPVPRMRQMPVLCYQHVGDGITLPRRVATMRGYLPRLVKLLREQGHRVLVRNTRPHPHPEVFEPHWTALSSIKWRWRQRETLERLLRLGHGQVKCPPAWGKSFMIACLCRVLPRARVAVSTYSSDVAQQLRDEIAKWVPSVGVCVARSKRRGDRVTCYGGKSLHHCREPVDALIVDEVHEWGTDDYMRRLMSPVFSQARRWAFSANVGDRTDGADFELEGVFGPLVAELPYTECVRHGCVAPVEIGWIDVELRRDPAALADNDTEWSRAAYWRNSARNEKVAIAARDLSKSGAQTLISVATIEHAMMLKRLLPDFMLCYSQDGLSEADRRGYVALGCISPSEPRMTVERRLALKRAFESGRLRKAIATSVWKRGVDFRRLEALIRADGESTMIADTQWPGRPGRTCAEIEDKVAVVIDLRDQFSDRARGRADRRRSHYTRIGFHQSTWRGATADYVEARQARLLESRRRRLERRSDDAP